MKIAIISDIHDNLINLQKCLNWLEKNNIEVMICCGDLTNEESLGIISAGFAGKIWLVRGNADNYLEEEVGVHKNVDYLGKYGRIEIGKKFYGICHEPYYAENIINELGNCKMIFYGHTHKPWIDDRNDFKMVNPGNLGGVINKATFAIWEPESGGIELKILEQI